MKRKSVLKNTFTLTVAAALLATSFPAAIPAASVQQIEQETVQEPDGAEYTETIISEEQDNEVPDNETMDNEALDNEMLDNEVPETAADTAGQTEQVIKIGDQAEAACSVSMESGEKILTFTISGTGSTYNYDRETSKSPLYDYVQKELPQTVRLIVEDGVTNLGDYLFCDIVELKTFQLSDTVVSIGNFSFCTTGITELSLPDTLKKSGYNAFSNCQNLQRVLTTGGLSYIPRAAFSSCPQLSEVFLSETYAESIGRDCFDYCPNLTAVHIPPKVYDIDEDWDFPTSIFSSCSKVSIYGLTNTYAEKYAAYWNVNFISEGIYETQQIPLDEAHFPDPYFRASLQTYDYDNDGYLDMYNLQNLVTLAFKDDRIQDFTGIEYFTKIISLRIISNEGSKMYIKKLDLSQNKKLFWLEMENCVLDSLNFGETPFITNVDLTNCEITDNNLQALSNVTSLTLDNISWDSIDVSPLNALESIYISCKNMTNLDVSSIDNLKSLTVDSTPLTELTLGDGKNLESLRLIATELPHLNLENKSALDRLLVIDCPVSELDLTECTSLKKAAVYFTDCTRDKIKRNKNQKNLNLKMAAKQYSLYVGSTLLIPIEKLDDFKEGFLVSDHTYFNPYYADVGELQKITNSSREITALKVPAFEGNKKTFRIRICASTTDGRGKTICELPVTVQKVHASVKKPKLKSLKVIDHRNMKLTWYKVSDADGYVVYCKKEGGKWKRIKTLSSKYTSYTDKSTSRISGYTYTYTVRAFKTVKGEEVTGPYDKKGLSAIPGKPDKVVITSAKAGKRTATLHWKRAGAGYGYRIYRATAKNGKYEKIATLKFYSYDTYKDTGLKSGKTYYYKIRAYNHLEKFIWGPYSDIKAVKVK